MARFTHARWKVHLALAARHVFLKCFDLAPGLQDRLQQSQPRQDDPKVVLAPQHALRASEGLPF